MIQVKNFSKSYSNQIIIKESNFEIKSQRISFLMGPNGAGKTTTIKCLMGMENHLGEILFDGKKIDQVRDRCLVIWDDCPFYTNLSGFQNLLIFGEGKKSKNEIKEIASKYLDYHTIKNKVKTYSYGQKKKLALVLVEILEPKYLIMDEISNGLDFDMIRNLQKSIKSWSNSMTILLTGHQFSFYNEIIDDVFVIRDKEIVLLQENFSNSGIMLEDIYDEENS
ncbi:MAG: ABC transporter ATP-binding protein [Caldibacillus debilis]|jgi:ABC-2 type transport system ATP-binding protein|uniref:ATP-binding cassette domain-containing protein n=1 Tax=Caldibacillus debilis TaxID=301148 RepID=UPI000E3B0BB9|nr:ATP-binding cassette domain-containing protein [Caldibacillus debilis]REJ14269.1 MAG: ABC transporter ATP-binding protein [Caldibacillus debilis]